MKYSVDYMLKDGFVKTVVRLSEKSFSAVITVNGKRYEDSFNRGEPYDRLTHIFYIPSAELKADTVIYLEYKRFSKINIFSHLQFTYGEPEFNTENELAEKYDNGLTLVSEEKTNICDGADFFHRFYQDKNSAPVHAFITKFTPDKAFVYVGTPDDGYASTNVKATIPDMISSAEKNGHNIVAAVNADFFDIFGDGHPSGLCVKNGKKISCTLKERAFVALLKSGEHVITDLNENPDILPDTVNAAAGMQMIVKNGGLFDFAPLEPFGFTRHPRTAVGICPDKSLVLLVVDGRIPEYSNGASLVDLAKIMMSFGVDRAINMDGGGSSAMYIKNNGGFELKNRPADLVRPKAMLIRKDYNSLLIEKYVEKN